MPNKWTFEIPPIRELIERHHVAPSADPFAGQSRIASFNNDIDPGQGTPTQDDALEYLSSFGDRELQTVLFDPPYSPRQVSESYKKLGMTVNRQTTQSSFWGNIKKEIARIIIPGGKVITCGWNSGGIGKRHGFEIIEILLVAHGGWHNDTIVTVERKEDE